MSMRRYMDRRSPSGFKLQITSMVDMFVLLLIFLLMNYSSGPVTITATKDLTLPSSNSFQDPGENTISVIVSLKGIFIEDKEVIALQDGKLAAQFIDKNDASFLPALFAALDAQADRKTASAVEDAKEAAAAGEKVDGDKKFDGRILVQADRTMSFDLLQKVMYTSMMAGFSDVQLAVLTQ